MSLSPINIISPLKDHLKVKIPPIKCQGIKTKLVPWIQHLTPVAFNGLWIEPFSGTGVVAFNVATKAALLCDTNPHLINFYQAIQQQLITSKVVKKFLIHEGNLLLKQGEEHYYFIRERFNKNHDPLDFLFLNRAGFNGMIRFNRKGSFNVPFCRKNNRFAQAYITKITNQVEWVAKLLQLKSFTFICQPFSETVQMGNKGDMIYCDPPYIDRHADYYNGWQETQEQQLFSVLSNTACHFMLSTWHHNDYRKNHYIDSLWNRFNVFTRSHFYHVGGSEKNRSAMIEAIITNFNPSMMDNVEQNARKARAI